MLLGLLVACQAPVEEPASKAPGRLEFSYETGHGNSYTEMILAGTYDGYDSEKQTRYVDTVRGQTTYKAPLSDNERNAIYEAVTQNGLHAIQTDFMALGGSVFPRSAGRLQVKADNKVTEIRFIPNARTQRFSAAAHEDWTRLQKALDVINGILRSKDDKQALRERHVYF